MVQIDVTELRTIKIVFLTTDTTNFLQSMGQSVVKDLKVYYRKKILFVLGTKHSRTG